MTRPEIAVLMPVYNPGDEIGGTLDSLRAQSVPFRLFLIDDGSKKNVDYEALCHGMDVNILRLPKNLGITGALNAGLAEILKGSFNFIARMDNGDYCHPERFAKQLAFLKAHPDISIVSSWVRYVYQLTGVELDAKLPTSPEACARLLRYNAPITHTAMMLRSSVFRELGPYDPEYPAAEDYALEFKAFANGHRFCNLPEPLLTTVEMRQSISGQKRAIQLKSRLRLQFAYADWLNPHTYLGIARTVVLMFAPISLIRRVKAVVKSA